MVLPAQPARPDADAVLHVTPGMEVYDTFDHKLGTIAHVHEGPVSSGGIPGGDDVLEVKTGFLGLGKHLFIPRGAVRDVTEGGVFVGASREEIDRHGWSQRPAALGRPDLPTGAAGDDTARAPAHPAGEAWATWEEAAPHYRARGEQRYGATARWEAYEARYRFAWELGRVPGLAGAPWSQAEPELRRRWEVLHPDTEWGTAADTVRDAWEHVPTGHERAV